ncbi:hypothetical protein N2152v2_009788 [Parachlorella kessleri]
MQVLTTSRPGLLPARLALRPALQTRRPLRVAASSSIPSRPSGGSSRTPPGSGTPPSEPVTNGASAAAAAAPAAPLAAAAAAPSTGPQLVTVSGPVTVSSVLPPAAVYEAAANLGAYKAATPFWKLVLLGWLAGCYVALGAALLLMVGPNCGGIASTNPGLAKYITGAIGFPYALLIILSCGSELFTGNTAVVTAALYEGKATFKQLIKSWTASYLGNILGCAFGTFLILNSGLTPMLQNGINAISVTKVSYPLSQAFVRALMANWFVCLAVWQYLSAQSFGGKFIACLGPISAFVCIGVEHCIANMVFVPLGILTGVSGVTWSAFIFRNLIPVTIGNIIAGAGFVATSYSLAYGSLGKKVFGK